MADTRKNNANHGPIIYFPPKRSPKMQTENEEIGWVTWCRQGARALGQRSWGWIGQLMGLDQRYLQPKEKTERWTNLCFWREYRPLLANSGPGTNSSRGRRVVVRLLRNGRAELFWTGGQAEYDQVYPLSCIHSYTFLISSWHQAIVNHLVKLFDPGQSPKLWTNEQKPTTKLSWGSVIWKAELSVSRIWWQRRDRSSYVFTQLHLHELIVSRKVGAQIHLRWRFDLSSDDGFGAQKCCWGDIPYVHSQLQVCQSSSKVWPRAFFT